MAETSETQYRNPSYDAEPTDVLLFDSAYGQSAATVESEQAEQANLQDTKESGKPAKPQEKKTREEIEKEAREAGVLLLNDSAKGEWSEKSQKTWKRLFEDIRSQPGATPERVQAALNEVGGQLNQALERRGSPYRVGMSIQTDAKSGETRFHMKLSGPGIKEADNLAVILNPESKDTKTCVRAGIMKSKKP